jgi:hypothetical protein
MTWYWMKMKRNIPTKLMITTLPFYIINYNNILEHNNNHNHYHNHKKYSYHNHGKKYIIIIIIQVIIIIINIIANDCNSIYDIVLFFSTSLSST